MRNLIKKGSRIVIEPNSNEFGGTTLNVYLEEHSDEHPIVPVNQNPETKLADGLTDDEAIGLVAALILDVKDHRIMNWLKNKEERERYEKALMSSAKLVQTEQSTDQKETAL